jgi:hypothetical protein
MHSRADTVNNNTCKTQLLGQRGLNEAKERVVPFLNPKIVYNEKTQSYDFQNSCAVPEDSANYFDISPGCLFKTKEDLYNPGSKGTENIYLENLGGKTYPEGCGIDINGQFDETVDEMSYSLDYDFLEQIYKLEQERDALKREIDELNRSIYERRRYIDGLVRGLTIANQRLKEITDWLTWLSNEPIFKYYNDAKKAYIDAANAYNTKVDQVVSHVNKINNDMRGAVLFSECGFSGNTKTIKINNSNQWGDWLNMAEFPKVGSIKVPPGMRIWLWSIWGGYFWAANYITGNRNWGYTGDCLQNWFTDHVNIARLESLGTYPTVNYRKLKTNPEAGRFLYWNDVFQD